METGKELTISVREMGRRLGIKKVESYWLVHKGYFKVLQVAGRMRVDMESFEYWYAGQVKYHKVSGEPPGERLRSYSYSAAEIGEILGICESHVHGVMKKAGVEPFLVDYWKRFRKDDFEKWYQNQTWYRTREDRKRDEAIEAESLSLSDIARLLDVTRDTVYSIVAKESNKDKLKVIVVAGKKRVTKESFEAWYSGQSEYLKPADREAYPDYKPGPSYADQLRADLMDRHKRRGQRLPLELLPPEEREKEKYLTIEQAAIKAGKSQRTICRWIKEKRFPAVILTPFEKSRIGRTEFEEYISKETEESQDGND